MDDDVIDDIEDDKTKENSDIDLQLINKHPEFKRAAKILDDLKKKFP